MTAEGWKCLESSPCFQRFESFDLAQDRLREAIERWNGWNKCFKRGAYR